MVEGTVRSIEIDAQPEACFEVAADIALYPEWATGVRQTEILENDSDGRVFRAAFVVDGMVKEIAYTLQYSYEYPSKMRWFAEPGGDVSELEGSYEFRDLGDGRTEVVYALRAEPTFTIPGFIKRQAEQQIVNTALRGLRRRVEEKR